MVAAEKYLNNILRNLSKETLTSIQHLGLPAFVPHTRNVSFTFCMTVMKLSHSSCRRERQHERDRKRGTKAENDAEARGKGRKTHRLEEGLETQRD